MHCNLPQCTVTCPNADACLPAALSVLRFLLASPGIRVAVGVGGPKCVWVSLFSAGSARGWSKMRLGLVVLAGFGWIRWDSDAFWTKCPPSPRSRPRLRRISDHRTTEAPGHWVYEGVTLFAGVGRRLTGRRASSGTRTDVVCGGGEAADGCRGVGLEPPPHTEASLTGRVTGTGLRPTPHAEGDHHPYI